MSLLARTRLTIEKFEQDFSRKSKGFIQQGCVNEEFSGREETDVIISSLKFSTDFSIDVDLFNKEMGEVIVNKNLVSISYRRKFGISFRYADCTLEELCREIDGPNYELIAMFLTKMERKVMGDLINRRRDREIMDISQKTLLTNNGEIFREMRLNLDYLFDMCINDIEFVR